LLLPDIEKKNTNECQNIMLQQVGAKGHLQGDDDLFKTKLTELFEDLNAVKLYTQPVPTAELNANDCGVFNCLQSRYYRPSPKNSIKLIEMVDDASKKYPLEKLQWIWSTIQSAMKNSIKHIDMVEDASKNYPLEKLQWIWLTTQIAMNKIIEEKGGKKFKIQHMNKETCWREPTNYRYLFWYPLKVLIDLYYQQQC
jgi:hypothetical protein